MKLVRKNVLIVFFFFGIIGTFFYPTLLFGKLPVPTDTLIGLYHPWRDLYSEQYPRGLPFKNFLITDPIRQQIPWRKVAIEEIKKGNIPAWNPYSFSGTPMLGNIQTGVLYPLNILFFLLPFINAWTILIMLQPLLAGLFLYTYLRIYSLRPLSRILASIAWGFSGVSISWLTWGTIVHTYLWLPLILLSIDMLIVSKQRRFTVAWASIFFGSLCSSFFAGHIQMFVYVFGFSSLYATYRLLRMSAVPKRKVLGVLLMGIVLFLLCTSVQWVELFALVNISSRVSDGNLMLKEGWFIPLHHFIQFLIPDFFGNPATLNYWGTWNYGEMVGYIGILPLLLAIYGMFQKQKDRLFWLGLFVCVLLFIVPSPMAKLPFLLHVPLLSSLQPTRLLFLFIFPLTIFSAIGFDALLRQEKGNRLILKLSSLGALIYVGIFVALELITKRSMNQELIAQLLISQRNTILPLGICGAGIFLFFILQKKRFALIGAIGIVALVTIDLFRFGHKFIPFTEAAHFFPETKIISYLMAQQKPFRILAVDDRILPPNVSTYYGLESPAGYDPVYSKYYEEFVASNNTETPNPEAYDFNRIIIPKLSRTALFRLFNVKYILSLGTIDDPNLRLIMQEGNTNLYQLTNVLPRAFLVQSVTTVVDPNRIISEVFNTDVGSVAVIEQPISLVNSPIQSGEKVTFSEYTSDQYRLESMTETERFMVITNNYHANWRATIDGNETSIYKTNGSFQGILIPKGIHTITFTYE